MILEKLKCGDLRAIRETCKTLGKLGIRPLFRDYRVNTYDKSIEKFEEMSRQSFIATSVHSLTICPLRLFPLNNQSDGNIDTISDGVKWESCTSLHFAAVERGTRSTSSEDPASDNSPEPSTKRWDIRIRRALSKLTECKRISIEDLDGPRILDSNYLDGQAPVTTYAKSIIRGTLCAVILSTIKIEHLSIQIGNRQAHPRFISIDMLPDLGQVYEHLRHLHISIDSEFSNPILLQDFVRGFPNLSEFSFHVSSNVFKTRSSGILEKLYIPELRKLWLHAIECAATELERFLLRHARTLQEVYLTRTTIPNSQLFLAGIYDLSQFSNDTPGGNQYFRVG